MEVESIPFAGMLVDPHKDSVQINRSIPCRLVFPVCPPDRVFAGRNGGVPPDPAGQAGENVLGDAYPDMLVRLTDRASGRQSLQSAPRCSA